jgi:leader peptidase (prepilin peptidase)/N-methyltransferase
VAGGAAVAAVIPPALAGAYAALVGAVVGSFLNVVIARVPEGESIVRPRSRCPACRRPIPWYDNLPVISWLVLRGRCRGCGARISPRYVVVELLGAAAGWLAWDRHGLSGAAVAELAFVAFLLALAAIDLDRWELPNELTRPLIVLGLLAAAVGLGAAPGLWSSAIGAAAGWVTFWAVMKAGALLARREAMGVGDVWLLAGLGAFLGVAALLPVVLLASIQGSVFGIAQLALGKGQPGPDPDAPPPDDAEDPDAWVPPRHGIPFGPFLVLGALEWLYAAGALAGWVPALDVFR